MPCYQPIHGWRTPSGGILIGNTKLRPDLIYVPLPCSKCIGCQQAHAKAWALRCQLELQQHTHACFSTLTYSNDNQPITLSKRHLQLWLKRLRSITAKPIRFFASGEYGEHTQRPHYHALLFGLPQSAANRIENAWALGHVRTTAITPQRVAYTAGYTAKKAGWRETATQERIDPDTGEVYYWQPPFIQMSRRPGIGAHARQWTQSWRLYAIQNGFKMPVPRFYHEAWKATATDQEKEELLQEKNHFALTRHTTIQQLAAGEKIAYAKQAINGDKRKL